MLPGAVGLDAPPYEIHSDDSPNLDGGIFRDARAVARQIMIPLHLHGIDRKTMKDMKRRLIQALNPKRGYCVLKFIEENNDPRYLYCYYTGGMEGDEGTEQSGFTWKRYGLQLTAFDPWYYSDPIQVSRWTFGGGSPFLSSTKSFFPLQLTSGLVTGSTVEVENVGDIEAWPIWELKGPMKAFRFTGPDGSSFGINSRGDGADILAGNRTLTIDTRPGHKSLKDNAGRNYWTDLAPNPVLWPIPEGTSTLSVDIIPGASNAEVQVTYRPRFEGY
ncbi:phage tail domain-containing protein [Streptomyces sp. NPDC002644]